MSVALAHRRRAADYVAGRHRYGVVMVLVLALVVFQIAAPAARWSFAVGVALAGAALTISVSTSRAPGTVRRRRALLVAVAGAVVIFGILIGVIDTTATFVVFTLLVALIPVTLAGGVVRLIQEEGVTAQVVAGALAMYLLVGLLFASIIAFVSNVMSGPYFVQGAAKDATDVYYSFTVLTTTGFGDYTARTSVGHALAVLEMLTGQLYLVTVIGIAVGNFAGRRMRGEQND